MMDLDQLQSVRDRERQTDKLQQLRGSFYADAAALVADLREERDRAAAAAEDPFDDPRVSRLTDQINTAEQTVEAIYEKRVGKLVKAASFAAADLPAETEGMTKEEQDLFDDLVEDIRTNRRRVLDVLAGKETGDEPEPGDDGPSTSSGVDPAAMMGGEEQPPPAPPGPEEAATGDGSEKDSGGESGENTVPEDGEGHERGDAVTGEADSRDAVSGDADSRDGVSRDAVSGDADSRDGVSRDEANGEAVDSLDGDGNAVSEAESKQGEGTTSGGGDEANAESGDHDGGDAEGDHDDVDGNHGDDGEESVSEAGSAEPVPATSKQAGAASAADLDRTTVRITQDVGEVFGVDERAYDLETDQVVDLPTANAEPLLEQDAAELIE